MAVKRKKVAAQRDMFPARKKLAEAAKLQAVSNNLSNVRQVFDGLRKDIDYLRGFTKSDSERLDLMVARIDDLFAKLTGDLTEVRSNLQRLAHAVELLNKRSAKGKKEPKAWTPEEYIRLHSEYSLMLRCDGEADMDVLREIHDCTMTELLEAVEHVCRTNNEA